MQKIKYYAGDGKKFFNITRAIEHSNIDPAMQKEILDEIEKLSLSCQTLSEVLESLDFEFERVKKIKQLILCQKEK